jgi:hypothetical protein
MQMASAQAQAESRALIARFFIDLRQALRLTVPQAAHYLAVRPDVVEALETGQVEYLPAWPDTSAIIMTYTSMAGVNGRPVLNAIGTLFTQLSVPAAPPPTRPQPQVVTQPQPQSQAQFRRQFSQTPLQPTVPLGRPAAPQPQSYGENHGYAQGYAPVRQQVPQQQDYRAFPPRQMPQRLPAPVDAHGPADDDEAEPDIARSGLQVSSRNLLRAGSAIASGARRLPQQALDQVRERPQRALYALSLPLGVLFILMHSSIFATIAQPFEMAVQRMSTYFQEHYGPVRDGLRYIEVDDPETRRADKLQISGGS